MTLYAGTTLLYCFFPWLLKIWALISIFHDLRLITLSNWWRTSLTRCWLIRQNYFTKCLETGNGNCSHLVCLRFLCSKSCDYAQHSYHRHHVTWTNLNWLMMDWFFRMPSVVVVVVVFCAQAYSARAKMTASVYKHNHSFC